MKKVLSICWVIIMILYSNLSSATTYYSNTTGGNFSAAIWSTNQAGPFTTTGATITSSDDIIIQSSGYVVLDEPTGYTYCRNITVGISSTQKGFLNAKGTNITYIFNGDITIVSGSGFKTNAKNCIITCNNLTVNSGATLTASYTTVSSGGAFVFFNILGGTVTNNGSIGAYTVANGGGNCDVIGFQPDGINASTPGNVTFTGTGTWNIAGIQKGTNNSTTTNLTIDANINIGYGAAGLINAKSNTTFNVTVNSGKTVLLATGYYPTTGTADFGLNGGTGGTGNRQQGIYTINGTLQCQNLYIAANNTNCLSTDTYKTIIGTTGKIIVGASGTLTNGTVYGNNATTFAGSGIGQLQIMSGGLLQIYGQTATSLISSSTSKNVWNFDNNSTVEYAATGSVGTPSNGNQTIENNFGAYGNLKLSFTAGTKTIAATGLQTINGNLTVTSNMVVTATNGLAVAGSVSNNGIINGALTLNGTSSQAISGTGTIASLTLNNSTGATMSGATQTISSALTLSNGILTLGTGNLSAGSISGGSTSYIDASGAGYITLNAVGSTQSLLPIGIAASGYYAPLTFTNTTNTPNITVGLQGAITNTPANPSNVVNLQWSILSNTSSSSDVSFQYATANQASGYSSTGAVLATYASNAYSESPLGVVSSGGSPFTISKTALSLPTSAASLYAIGNPYAFVNTSVGVPTIGTAMASGVAQASVAFTPPAVAGSFPITSYTVTSTPGSFTATGASSPLTVSGLTGGTSYTFTVTATNSQSQTSVASAASNTIIAYTAPAAPTGVVAADGDAQATISFTAPNSNDGAAIASYTVTANPGAITATGSTSPITVTGLNNGISYTFTVTATNSHSLTGASSTASSAVIPSGSTTWNGTAWSNGLPSAAANVEIAGNLTYAQWGPATSVVKLIVDNGATFANTGNITITGSSFVNNGTISGGTINMVGSAAQTISGTGLVSSLTINNTNGVSISNGSNNLGITGVLTLQKGTFTTNGNLTMKSLSIVNTGILAPIDGTINTGSITGNVTIERYIPKGYRAYRDLCVGGVYNTSNTMFNTWQESGSYSNNGYGIFVTGGSADNTHTSNYIDPTTGLDHTKTGYASAYYYNGAWNTITNTKNVSMNPYQSFRVLIRGDRSFDLYTTPIHAVGSNNNILLMVNATTLRATGGLIYGTVTYSATGITNNITGSTYNSISYALSNGKNSYSYIANPYACPIDFHNIYSNGHITNMVDGYWYLDPTIGATGKYVAYNAIANTNNTGATYGNFIQPGQGFLVCNYNSSSPTLKITEVDKSTLSTSLTSVFGTATPSSKIVTMLLSGANSTRLDAAVAVFGNSFSNGLGLEDSRKLTSGNENLSIKVDTDYLSIDGRLPALASDSLSLVLGELNNTQYLLKVDASNYQSNGLLPYLLDNYKQITTPLNGIDTFAFTVDTSIASSYTNRFKIIFKPNTLPVNSIVASATLNSKVAKITWNTVGEKNVSYYQVEKSSDAKTFEAIEKTTAKNNATASYAAADNITSTSFYRIKAVSTTGSFTYSNVVKLSIENYQSSIRLYPNPLNVKTLNVTMENVVAGKYTISLYNVLGEKVVSEQAISHEGGNGTYVITIKNTLAAGIYSVIVRDASNNKMIHQTKISVQP